jgi:Adenine deaminase (EC 3.5.4.2)
MSECIKAITEDNMDSRRCILATDDMLANDLETLGHMNEIIRRTISEGVNPVEAIQMATINPATYFGLSEVGCLAPGKYADIAVIDDLNNMDVSACFINGKLVAINGELIINLPSYRYPDTVKNSVKREHIVEKDLEIRTKDNQNKVRCIKLIPDQNLTGRYETTIKAKNGVLLPDISNDVLEIACLERYGRNNNIGKAFVSGFGLKNGAIAESVAHDTHNLLVVGTNLKDMVIAINAVIDMGGGLAASLNGRIISQLRLPVGGLITDELNGHQVSEKN